jgi:hypothetical protein
MSERSSFSSMKYGPSVSAGRTMHEGRLVLVAAAAVVATTPDPELPVEALPVETVVAVASASVVVGAALA